MTWLCAILEGMASLLDIGGTLRKESHILTDEEARQADAEAIAGDWRAVGDNLRRAMDKVGREIDGRNLR